VAKDTIIFFKLCTHTLIFHWYQITTGTINNICYFTSALIQKSLFYTRSAIIKQYFIGFSWQYILQQKPNYCRNPNSYLHLSAIQSLNYLLPFLSSNHTPLFYKLRKVVMLLQLLRKPPSYNKKIVENIQSLLAVPSNSKLSENYRIMIKCYRRQLYTLKSPAGLIQSATALTVAVSSAIQLKNSFNKAFNTLQSSENTSVCYNPYRNHLYLSLNFILMYFTFNSPNTSSGEVFPYIAV